MSAVKYNSRYIITDVTVVKFIGQWIIAGNCINLKDLICYSSTRHEVTGTKIRRTTYFLEM
jgi:hypothetical protein